MDRILDCFCWASIAGAATLLAGNVAVWAYRGFPVR